jgi:CO dehydrogenase maturation factor
VEPGQRSIDCAQRIIQLAGEIGIKNIQIVANKVQSEIEKDFIASALPGRALLGVIPYSGEFRKADREGKSVLDGLSPGLLDHFEEILEKLEESFHH